MASAIAQPWHGVGDDAALEGPLGLTARREDPVEPDLLHATEGVEICILDVGAGRDAPSTVDEQRAAQPRAPRTRTRPPGE